MSKCIISLFLMALLVACEQPSSGDSNTSSTVPTTGEPATSTTASESEVTPAVDRSTLEGFWSVFQKAVTEQDKIVLQSLYAPDASFYAFDDEDSMERIANSASSEVEATGEQYQGKDVYAYFMSFEGDDPTMEGSETSIYLCQNKEGLFEIFNVLQGG